MAPSRHVITLAVPRPDQTTIFVDAMYKYNGFSFMGEYAKRTADNEIATEIDGVTPTGDVVLTGNALNLQAGYLFKNNYVGFEIGKKVER